MKSNIKKPLLSVGIIFRNEIRCIERCLQSLQVLKEKIPCEIVMADTGSEDGSREIAAKYADILIDFPWINDFSAARNAVLERCTGKWYLTVDCDEWLDPDVSELLEIIHQQKVNVCFVVQRNYRDECLKTFSDFLAKRLVLRSAIKRYEGSIHEEIMLCDIPLEYCASEHTILHHDGYVDLSGERGKEKRRRNLDLLRGKLKQDPDNLLTIDQFTDAAIPEPDEDIHTLFSRAVALIKEHTENWDRIGASLISKAIMIALGREWPEADAWIKTAYEECPKSYFVRIDVNWRVASTAYHKQDYQTCIEKAEEYLRAKEEAQKDSDSLLERIHGSFFTDSPYYEQKRSVSDCRRGLPCLR